jgi:hypothetical protein
MGAGQSTLGKKLPSGVQTMIKGIGFSSEKEFTPLSIPKIIDLEYILDNRPSPVENIKQQSQVNNNLEIAQIILNYNNDTWNFGNKKNVSEGNDRYHKLMIEDIYKKYLNFVKSKLSSTSKLNIQNNSFPNEVKSIIEEISKKYIPKVNDFFTVKLSSLFPEIKSNFDDSKDFINVTLLGLAAIIGAEHLVIYFLMRGARPNITYSSENQDTATLMLSYQIAFSKIMVPDNYFIFLGRILYILFLLGSIGAGVDLSNIYKSNYKIFKKNQDYTEIQESILHQLVRMDNDYVNLSNNNSLIYLTMKNGASIPLLFKILEKNNISNRTKSLKLFSTLDSKDIPFGYTILYSLLLNNSIKDNIKLSLVYYIIKLDANPLIIPDILQNSRIKENIFIKKNKTEIQLLFALLQNSNITILEDLLNILSMNPKFDNLYKEFKITKPGFSQNKNYTIQQLYQNNERLKKILAEVSRQKAIQTESAIIESELLRNISKNNTMTELLKTQAAGGFNKNSMRTFNFVNNKKYSDYSFKSERPITAAYSAYNFLKLNNKIDNIQFSIYDINNNKKYNYIAKTLKDGTSIIKSYK